MLPYSPTQNQTLNSMSQPNSFSYFSLLPPELRLNIYTYLHLTPRTIELEFSPPSQTWIPIYYSPSTTIPVLLHLTPESRSYALSRYHYIPSLNIWLDPKRDSIYLRSAPGQISSGSCSASQYKWWALVSNGGLDCLRYLVVGEEAWDYIREDKESLDSMKNLKEISLVTREDLFPIWPENEVVLNADRRRQKEEEQSEKIGKGKMGPVIKYMNVRRRFKGVLMGREKDGAFVREEIRDGFAVGW